MPRRYIRYRPRRALKTVKYSNETTYGLKALTPQQSSQTNYQIFVVPPTLSMGTRKVKNITLNIGWDVGYFLWQTDTNGTRLTDGILNLMYWALVFVPQGQNPGDLQLNAVNESNQASSIYEPNQNIIMTGVCDLQSQNATQKVRTRLARNLNSGDSICFVACILTNQDYNPSTLDPVQVTVAANYAICYS